MAGVVLSLSSPDFWERWREIHTQDSLFVSPTDTVYGLGVLVRGASAKKRLQRIKPREHFITLIKDWKDAEELALIEDQERKILKRYWPGAITFVLKGKETSTIALRMPKNDFLESLLEKCGGPMLSTSCNFPGESPVTSLSEAVKLFGSQIDYYIDGGVLPASLPSTLVDLTTATPQILRKGLVNFG